MAGKHADIAESLLEDLKRIHGDINGPYSREAKTLNPNF
jgi:hypothetical protein